MKIVDFFSGEYIDIKDELNLYVCGPTVYDDPHIGNMRPIIFFDILNRVFSLEGKVNFVHNITDVDDKIILRAKELKIKESDLAVKYENEYLKLLDKLNIIKPNHMPKVTNHIPGMINFIQDIIDKKYAYEKDGSIYFDVINFKNYSKKDLLNLEGLTNKEDLLNKKNSNDFVLWKKTNEGINWDSPWGKGRPGWHTECAYFVKEIFGNNGIDVHGGGIDLKFPHHINEMAQYEAVTGNDLSKLWFYVGHVEFENIKMSKSKNNFISAKDFIKNYGANTLRMIMIVNNITKPININDSVIINSQKIITKIKNCLVKSMINFSTELERELNIANPSDKFIDVLKDNLNTSEAITMILEQVKNINSEKNINRKADMVEELIADISLLGFSINVNYNQYKDKLKNAKINSNYQLLDELKKEIIT